MKRRNFLRNAMMALVVSFVPKILQPLVPDVTEGECYFDEAKINEQLVRLREYPLTEKQCFSFSYRYTYKDGEIKKLVI